MKEIRCYVMLYNVLYCYIILSYISSVITILCFYGVTWSELCGEINTYYFLIPLEIIVRINYNESNQMLFYIMYCIILYITVLCFHGVARRSHVNPMLLLLSWDHRLRRVCVWGVWSKREDRTSGSLPIRGEPASAVTRRPLIYRSSWCNTGSR